MRGPDGHDPWTLYRQDFVFRDISSLPYWVRSDWIGRDSDGTTILNVPLNGENVQPVAITVVRYGDTLIRYTDKITNESVYKMEGGPGPGYKIIRGPPVDGQQPPVDPGDGSLWNFQLDPRTMPEWWTPNTKIGDFSIEGGTPPYNFFVDDPGELSLSVNGTALMWQGQQYEVPPNTYPIGCRCQDAHAMILHKQFIIFVTPAPSQPTPIPV